VSASTIPTFLNTLLGLLTLDNTLFGPPTTNEEMTGLYLMADENGAKPIDFSQTWLGQGSHKRSEHYNIACLLFRRTGDSDPTSAVALFDAALADFETVAALFRPDASLGINGYTLRSQLTAGTCLLLPRADGLLARIAFTITVDATI
jgi:hypothetical protein